MSRIRDAHNQAIDLGPIATSLSSMQPTSKALLWWEDEIVRDNGSYDRENHLGRGCYRVVEVERIGRQSIVVADRKYDRTTGYERGVKVGYPRILRGRREAVDSHILSMRYKLAELVKKADVEDTTEIARILGVAIDP